MSVMNIFKCCRKTSVAEKPKSSDETPAASSNDDRKEPGTSSNSAGSLQKKPTSKFVITWRKCKKWVGKHFLCWKKHKNESNVVLTTSEEIENGSMTAEPSREDVEQRSTQDTAEDSASSAVEETCDKADEGSAETSDSSCASKESVSSTVCSEKENGDEQSIATQDTCDEDKETDDPTAASEDGSESDDDDRATESESSSSYSSYDDDNSSSVDSDDDADQSVTKIQWMAEDEEELREENIRKFVSNLVKEYIGENVALRTRQVFLPEKGQGGEFCLGEKLGKGAFGSVRQGKWTTRKMNGQELTKNVAIKIISAKHARQLLSSVKELRALTRSKHPNIIELQFVLTYARRTYFGLELVSGGDLKAYLEEKGPLPDNQARIWFEQIVDAIRHCHLNGIAHMDVQPQNILIYDEATVKLTDFGVSLVQPDPANITAEQFESDALCQMIVNMAPEVFSDNTCDSRKCDVWCLGLLLFVMLTGEHPFSFGNIEIMYNLPKEDLAGSNYLRHAKNLYALSPHTGLLLCRCGFSAGNLILQMLQVNPEDRATIWEIQQHEWLAQK